jgi:hypothetical protein
MIDRAIANELRQAATEYPVVTVLGPRQSGKTTLVRRNFSGKHYLSLENPDTRMTAEEDPRGFLAPLTNGAILDEVQRVPHLLSYLQGVVDESGTPGQFILTGSHQPQLHQAISQSLAGRTALLTLWPFSVMELREYRSDWDAFELIVQGCYPRLHEEQLDARRYYNNYLQTYVERDVRALIQLRDLNQFQRFLTLLAGRIGQIVNYTSLANDVGVSSNTIKNWLSVLTASYVIFELPPFFENIRKRLVKSPKIYFTDTGLAAFLLGIHTPQLAARDPLRGGLYENLIIADIMKGALNRGIRPEFYFYRDSHGNEVDLLIRENGRLTPVEIKSGATFNKDFLKGLHHFAGLNLGYAAPGTVLFNGDQEHTLHGVRAYNPLNMDDIWTCLTRDSENGHPSPEGI